jgi:V8-like Glu-specific endopeptidase
MPLDSSTYPYDTIVYLTDTIGGIGYQGSGVLISPDEVLTASHVVWDAGVGTATNIVVTPGFDRGSAPDGSADGVSFHYNRVEDSGGTLTFDQSENDFAVIHLSHPFSVGTMGLETDFTGGLAIASGYPGTATGTQIDQPETFAEEPDFSLLSSGGLGPGSSGGPVWIENVSGQAKVVGITSTGDTNGVGYFTQITPAVAATINSWVAQDDAPKPVAVPASNGQNPTELSANDQAVLNAANAFGPQVGAASMTFLDGDHIGADFSNLGAAAAAGQEVGPFNNQLFSDLKALLGDWNAAQPGITNGINTPGGPPVALPAQFVVNIVNDGLNTIVEGAGPADQAFGTALATFFGIDQSLLLAHTG